MLHCDNRVVDAYEVGQEICLDTKRVKKGCTLLWNAILGDVAYSWAVILMIIKDARANRRILVCEILYDK